MTNKAHTCYIHSATVTDDWAQPVGCLTSIAACLCTIDDIHFEGSTKALLANIGSLPLPAVHGGGVTVWLTGQYLDPSLCHRWSTFWFSREVKWRFFWNEKYTYSVLMYAIICIHILYMQRRACVVQYNITSFTNMISIIFCCINFN